MHNYVVRGHHDGNISVPRHHMGAPSLHILLCAALIKWRLTLSTMAAGEIQWVLVFTNLSSCLLKKKKKLVRQILTGSPFAVMATSAKVFLVICC